MARKRKRRQGASRTPERRTPATTDRPAGSPSDEENGSRVVASAEHETHDGSDQPGNTAVDGLVGAGGVDALSRDFLSGSFDLPEDEELSREERIERVERSKARRHRRKIVRRIVWTLVVLFLLAVVAACATFAAFRWYVWDDAADLRGTWRIVGTEKQVEITEDTIVLTDDVAYKYTVDPWAKTISFKFGNMAGQARYRFSLDRQLLSITDGEYDEWMTLGDDAPWTLAALWKQLTANGAQLSPGQGQFTTELTRQLDPASDGAAETGSGTIGGDAAGDQNAGTGATGAEGPGGTEGTEGASDGSSVGEEGGAGDGAGDGSSGAGSTSSASSTGGSSGSSSTRDVDSLDISDIAA